MEEKPSQQNPICPVCRLPVHLDEPTNVEHGEVFHLACAGAKPPVTERATIDEENTRPAA
jgi:hypothetical protein